MRTARSSSRPGGVSQAPPGDQTPSLWTEWQTGVNILPCPKLRLRAVSIRIDSFYNFPLNVRQIVPFVDRNPLKNETLRKKVKEGVFSVFFFFYLLRTERESIETGGGRMMERGRVGFPRKHGCKLCSESRDVYVSLSTPIKGRSHRMKTKAKT